MSFRDSNFCPPIAAYGLPSPGLPPTPPPHWFPPSSPSYGLPPPLPSGYCDFTAHGTNQGHRNPGFGSGNDYFSQRIGHNYDYFGQGLENKYHLEIQTHLEKERIRDEIIAEEIAWRWRRILEAEVREELRREGEAALRLKGGNPLDIFRVPVGKSSLVEAQELSLEERIARCVEERLRIRGGFETAGVDTVPFKRMKERVVFVAKPGANPSATTKQVPSSATTKQVPSSATTKQVPSSATTKQVPSSAKEGANKTGFDIGSTLEKKVLVCAICQVFTTSEYDLNEHFGGKKHKTNEAAVKADRKCANIGLGVSPKDRLAGHEKSMEADLKGKIYSKVPPKKTQATQIWAVKVPKSAEESTNQG